MKRVDAFCNNCENEFGVELIDTETVVTFCPVCSEKLDDVEVIDLDGDFMEEGWED